MSYIFQIIIIQRRSCISQECQCFGRQPTQKKTNCHRVCITENSITLLIHPSQQSYLMRLFYRSASLYRVNSGNSQRYSLHSPEGSSKGEFRSVLSNKRTIRIRVWYHWGNNLKSGSLFVGVYVLLLSEVYQIEIHKKLLLITRRFSFEMLTHHY